MFGVIVGLPAMRLRTFYFAMTTLGFATIVTQIALAWQSVDRRRHRHCRPGLSAPFNTPWGFYYLCIGFAAVATWLSANIAYSRFGRALIAIRDADVAAEATGISKPKLLVSIFLLAGAMAAFAGGVVRQPADLHHAGRLHLRPLGAVFHRHPDRRSRLDPRPDARHHHPHYPAGDRGPSAPRWSTFLYAVLLLLIVLVMPGGIAALLDFKSRRPLASNRAIVPRIAGLVGCPAQDGHHQDADVCVMWC